jgi:hypothetical protein
MIDMSGVKDIKEDLKNFIHGHLSSIASPLFLKRAMNVIEDSQCDKESLIQASYKVSRMTALFIDQNLSEKVFKDLRKKIDESG